MVIPHDFYVLFTKFSYYKYNRVWLSFEHILEPVMIAKESPAPAEVLDDDVDIVDAVQDQSLAIPQYSITSYGIDYDVEGLVRRLNKEDIVIPKFQRDFVWNQAISSRFIESLLLGLPVPGIFLYRMDDDRYQVIDGQRRVRSLQSYYEGSFQGKPFKLVRLDNTSKFQGLTYEELDGIDRRRLDNSIIHATVIKQEKPDDNGSSKFSIFERLNTNAKPLSAQEIRAAIYLGEFNNLLVELNANKSWRSLFGKKHSRKRDEELILRFLALFFCTDSYSSPMKKFLNNFMSGNRHLKRYPADQIRRMFEDTVDTILQKIGERAFIPTRAVNAALCDSLMIGIARRLESGPILSDLHSSYSELRNSDEYIDLISDTTSAPERLRRRVKLATNAFAKVE